MDTHQLYQSALKDFGDNKLEEANQKLHQVLEKDPQHEDAYEALAVTLYTQKNYDYAIYMIKKWIKQNPNSIMAQTNLSRCYVAKEMILEAENAQAEARRLTWMAELKEKKQQAPKVDYQEKIERYKQVIELDPKDVLGYFSLGQTYLDAGMKRESVDTFAKAIEVNADHSSSYFGYGQALEGLGDPKKALEIYQKGVKIAEKQGDVLTQRRMESRIKALKN